jgi:hypothetical protein
MPELGELGLLARALGLVDGDGQVEPGWFAAPGDHLATMLGDPGQRTALLDFVDTVLGGSSAGAGAGGDGRREVPIVEHAPARLSIAVDDTSDPDEVRLGWPSRSTWQRAPTRPAAGRDRRPIVGTPASGAPPGRVTRLLLGDDGGIVTASVSVLLPTGADAGAGVRLASVSCPRPSRPAAAQRFGALALRGLVLPGGAGTPRERRRRRRLPRRPRRRAARAGARLVRAQAASLPPATRWRGSRACSGSTERGARLPARRPGDEGCSGARRLAGRRAGRRAGPDGLAAGSGRPPRRHGERRRGRGAHRQPHRPAVRVSLDVAPGTAGLPRVVPTVEAVLDGAAGVALSLRVQPVAIDLGSGSRRRAPGVAGKRAGHRRRRRRAAGDGPRTPPASP